MNGSDCPCWTDAYLDQVEHAYKELLPASSSSSSFWTWSETVNAAIGNSGYPQISAQKHSIYQTGYQCRDRANNRYVEIVEEEFRKCVEDIVEMEGTINDHVCKLAINETATCPCWIDGLPSDISDGDDDLRNVNSVKSATIDLANGDRYEAQAWAFYPELDSCESTVNGVYNHHSPLTNQEFNKCYNDILRKTCERGLNPCAVHSGACLESSGPMPSPSSSPIASDSLNGTTTMTPTLPPTVPTPPSNCPCWTGAYLEDLESYFKSIGPVDTPVSFWSGSSAAVGHGGSLYQISVQKNSIYSTGYACYDKANSKQIYISEEEYGRCGDDILKMDDRIATNICTATLDVAASCPCWPNGLPADVSAVSDSIQNVLSIKMATVTLANGDQYEAQDWATNPDRCETTVNGVYNRHLPITNQEFNKCYNDLLSRICEKGSNPCAIHSGSCFGTSNSVVPTGPPSSTPTLYTTYWSSDRFTSSIHIGSKLYVRFYVGHEGRPSQVDLENLIPEVVAFFTSEMNHDPYFANDFLKFDIADPSYTYITFSKTVVLDFVSQIKVYVPGLEGTKQEIAEALGRYDLQRFIREHVWMAEPFKENQFYHAQWVQFIWRV